MLPQIAISGARVVNRRASAYDKVHRRVLGRRKIGGRQKGALFRTATGQNRGITLEHMVQADVYRMIKRRAKEAGIKTEIGCHTFRATGITAYLKNGGRLEVAQQMAAHESARRFPAGCG